MRRRTTANDGFLLLRRDAERCLRDIPDDEGADGPPAAEPAERAEIAADGGPEVGVAEAAAAAAAAAAAVFTTRPG